MTYIPCIKIFVTFTKIKLYFATSLGGTVDRNQPANAGDMDLIPGPGRFHMP